MTEGAKAEATLPARFVRTDISVDKVVGEAAKLHGTDADDRAIYVLAHTPQCARFLMLRDSKLHDERDNIWQGISQVFELRLFCEAAEIAWRRDGETGRAVLTRDDGREPASDWDHAKTKGIEKLTDGERLLWGELDERTKELTQGWSWLSSPRVGSIYVPLQHPGSDRLRRAVLEIVEYARVADDGNVVPCGERLKGLGWR